jgi:polar amino acid transport system substrate-binding protein
MKRQVAGALLVAAMCAAGALGCGGDDGGSKRAEAAKPPADAKKLNPPNQLVRDGEFSTCMDISFPPMEYYEDASGKTPVGFDVDIVRSVAERWGVEPVYRQTGFDGLLPALSSGRCDVVWSAMFVTPERTKRFAAVPYYRTSRVLLVRNGNPEGISSPEDLAGKTVAAEAGTTYITDLDKLNSELAADGKDMTDIQGYPKATDAIQQLIVGRADAVMTNDTEAAFQDKQNEGQFETAYAYPPNDTFGVYYPPAKKDLGRALEEALEALKEDGTLERVAKVNHLPPAGFSAVGSGG